MRLKPAILAVLLGALPALAPAADIHDGWFLTSDQVRIHYLEAGSGPAIVFVPGWIVPAEVWTGQLQYFSARYRAIAMDPRSQGGSQVAVSGHEPLRRGQDIGELAAALGIHSFVLVGWSLGAVEALAFLKEFNHDNLAALVLVDGPIGGLEKPEENPRRTAFLRRLQTDRETATREFMRGLFKKPPPPGMVEQLTRGAMHTPTEIALELMNSMYPGDKWGLGHLKIPLLYAVTPRYQGAADFLKSVPFARVESFPLAGHALFVDEADHFNQVLEDFLDSSGEAPFPQEPAWVRARPLSPTATPLPLTPTPALRP